MRRLLSTAAVLLGALQPSIVLAQSGYPDKPIRLVVPFPAGGPNDVLSRVLAQKMTELIGQTVIVDNRSGAAGSIGGTLAAQAAPNGHHLLFGGPGVMATAPALFRKPPYDPLKDFAPISMVGTAQHLLLISPSEPIKSVNDLVALAKSKPSQFTYGGGTGTVPHLAGEMFQKFAGVKLMHVAYQGGGPVFVDLMAGRLTMYFSGISAALPLIKSHKLRGIAVTGPKRVPALPDMPTIGETLPGYDLSNWYAVYAPSGTPNAVITKLNGIITKSVATIEVQKRFSDLGSVPDSSTPDELRAFTQSEIKKWAELLKLAGIEPK